MGGASVEFLLDSVILIDRFNGFPEAREFISEIGTEAVLSVVTRAEVLVGFDAESQGAAARSLDRFPLLEITKPIADLAASLRRENGWKLPDAFQAALAQHYGLRLVTRNTRDCPRESRFRPGSLQPRRGALKLACVGYSGSTSS